jgi:hypothetical protein
LSYILYIIFIRNSEEFILNLWRLVKIAYFHGTSLAHFLMQTRPVGKDRSIYVPHNIAVGEDLVASALRATSNARMYGSLPVLGILDPQPNTRIEGDYDYWRLSGEFEISDLGFLNLFDREGYYALLIIAEKTIPGAIVKEMKRGKFMIYGIQIPSVDEAVRHYQSRVEEQKSPDGRYGKALTIHHGWDPELVNSMNQAVGLGDIDFIEDIVRQTEEGLRRVV